MFNCFQALALLADYIGKEDSSVRIGAILGLGVAYAGCQNDQVMDLARRELKCWCTLMHDDSFPANLTSMKFENLMCPTF